MLGCPRQAKRARSPSLLLLLAALCAWWCAGCSQAPAPRVREGYLTPLQVEQIIDRWPQGVRDQLVSFVYAESANRYVRACGEDPRRALPAATLSGEGFRLADRHAGDLSCALAEADVYLIAERGESLAITTLVAVVASSQVLEIDVQRSSQGVVRQVYALYSPATGRALRLRPAPEQAPAGRPAAVWVERQVTAAESLNAMRALLGRAHFDLSVVGVDVDDQALVARRR